MSSSFQDQLDAYKSPTIEDIELTLPPRRERPAAEGSDARAVGEHGGTADGSSAATDVHTGAAAGPSEPQPQRDDPDEGEHTDSTQEQVERRAAASAADTIPEESIPDEVPNLEGQDDGEVDDAPAAALSEDPPLPASAEPQHLLPRYLLPEGSAGRSFSKATYSVGDAPTMIVKRLPKDLIEAARAELSALIGEEFARAIPANSLLTAFLTAKLGVRLQLDENTAAAVDAFRQADPRMAILEDRIEDALAGLDRLAGAQKYVIKRVAETGKTVDALDMAASFLVTDRVASVSTPEVDETNIIVTQKKVLAARTRIHEQAARQKKIEQDRNERSTA